MAKGTKRSGGDAAKRHRALAAKGQGERALGGRKGRGMKHPRGEEHSRRRTTGWL
jgi:hypothetical protein